MATKILKYTAIKDLQPATTLWKLYRVFGAERAIETDYFEGRHRISGRRAYAYLWEKLGSG